MIAGRTRPPTISLDNARIAERHLAAVVLSLFFRAHSARFENVEGLVGDWAAKSGTSTAQRFVESHRTVIEASLRAIFSDRLKEELHLNGSGYGRLRNGTSR